MNNAPPPAAQSLRAAPTGADRAVVSVEVLRYWLTLLRHEEALGRRPKVRRQAERTTTELNLADPVPGQEYAKLPFASAGEFLTQQVPELRLDLDTERRAFFEDWILARYRRGDDEEDVDAHLVSFPTVHLARDELAGLLRFPVELRWHGDDGPFAAPTRSERRRRLYPSPPTGLTLIRPLPGDEAASEDELEGASESELPYFIDTRLLRETLRVDVERIDSLFSKLKASSSIEPVDLISAVTSLLETQNRLEADEPVEPASTAPAREDSGPTAVPCVGGASPPGASPEPQELLGRLLAAVADRLERAQTRAKVYGVALVIRADSTRATWHLQKDMEAALTLAPRRGLAAQAPVLEAYLTGSKLGMGEATCWGRWRGPTLTSSQRRAAERTLGSQLSAVQGPPGTGKTTLILNLAAHALVTRIGALARGGTMGTGITVIASTNNRAVDNVIDPLSSSLDGDELPLALRVGNRLVVDQVTREQLARSRRWLESSSATREESEMRLDEALRCFRDLRDELNTELEPWEIYRAARRHREALELELIRLGHNVPQPGAPLHPESTSHAAALDGLPSSPAGRRRALRLLRELEERLIEGSSLTEDHGRKVLRRVRRHFKRTHELYFAQVEEVLGQALPPHLPPPDECDDPQEALEAWEEGFEALIGEVSSRIEALERTKSLDAKQKRIEKTMAELAELDSKLSHPPAVPDTEARERLEARHQRLFELAMAVREAWARVHRAELLGALGRAAHIAEASRSLRSLMDSNHEAKRWLLQLFPTWGTTLLSMGNVFSPAASSLETVIIDEAGQCHPAYAVSALLRAQRALVIGDTFQLEPVFELREADEKRIRRTLALRVDPSTLEPYRCYESSTVSAQRLADRAVADRPTLIDHFRCQPSISAISEQLCGYGLINHTPRRSRSAEAPFLVAPVLCLAVEGQQQRYAGSWMNEAELDHTVRLVRRLLAAGIGPDEIGVITPYRGQLERLWRVFREQRLPVERLWSDGDESRAMHGGSNGVAGLALGTVHRFQGGERSIILFSTTLTRRDALGFVDGRVNLVNVAASRAREHLITIGCAPILRLGEHTRHLVAGAEALAIGIDSR